MKRSLFAAVAITVMSAPVSAADWVQVSKAANGDMYFVDSQSIRTMPSGYKRAWRRTVFGKPLNGGVTSARTLDEFDCKEGRRRTIQWTYFKEEEIKSSYSHADNWTYVAPDTSGEDLQNYVCFGPS